jgi:hypothetical protein
MAASPVPRCHPSYQGFAVGDRVLLWSPGWPPTLNPPVSTSLVLGLRVCTTLT